MLGFILVLMVDLVLLFSILLWLLMKLLLINNLSIVIVVDGVVLW